LFSLLSTALWYLVTACLNLFLLCNRISASFLMRLATSLLKHLPLPLEALRFLLRFSFITSFFVNSNHFYLQFYSKHCLTHLTISAQAQRVFNYKNVLRNRNYSVRLDHIKLEFNCASFILFKDSRLMMVLDFMAL